MKAPMKLATKLAVALAFSFSFGAAAWADSVNPSPQAVNVVRSMTIDDQPGARKACEEGTSLEASQILALAVGAATDECTSSQVDTWSARYNVFNSNKETTFDCLVTVRAFCESENAKP